MRTWYDMTARTAAVSLSVAGDNAAKAALVGAKTVIGPDARRGRRVAALASAMPVRKNVARKKEKTIRSHKSVHWLKRRSAQPGV